MATRDSPASRATAGGSKQGCRRGPLRVAQIARSTTRPGSPRPVRSKGAGPPAVRALRVPARTCIHAALGAKAGAPAERSARLAGMTTFRSVAQRAWPMPWWWPICWAASTGITRRRRPGPARAAAEGRLLTKAETAEAAALAGRRPQRQSGGPLSGQRASLLLGEQSAVLDPRPAHPLVASAARLATLASCWFPA